MAERSTYEVVIVGGGIAGASLAYFLAEAGLGDVLILEREQQLSVHSTGRSAATLNVIDAVPTLQEILIASAPFLRHPPPGFSEHPVLRVTGALSVFSEGAWEAVRTSIPTLVDQGLDCQALSPADCEAHVPLVDPSSFAGGLLVPGDGRLDVHEILSSYLRHARAAGAEIRLGANVESVLIEAGRCCGVVVAGEEIRARLVVDAAGAWAGPLAADAGATRIPLRPHRRTIVTFPWPDGIDASGWPFFVSEAHELYFAPEGSDMLLSPMDEEEMEPCDPSPDDAVVAAGIARLGRLAPDLVPKTLRRRWSGLRTFSPDRVHIVGEDPTRPGFFWLAGQGGCGIESSPLIGSVAADLILTGATHRFDARRLAPDRFV